MDHQVFRGIAQSSAVSICHGNMPGLVSEPALLKTWPAAAASPSPALQHAKTSRSPDLSQAPCLPKTPQQSSVQAPCNTVLSSDSLACSGWRTEIWKDFSEAEKPVVVESSSVYLLPKSPPVPLEAPIYTFAPGVRFIALSWGQLL